jgi:hypothetical protein
MISGREQILLDLEARYQDLLDNFEPLPELCKKCYVTNCNCEHPVMWPLDHILVLLRQQTGFHAE